MTKTNNPKDRTNPNRTSKIIEESKQSNRTKINKEGRTNTPDKLPFGSNFFYMSKRHYKKSEDFGCRHVRRELVHRGCPTIPDA